MSRHSGPEYTGIHSHSELQDTQISDYLTNRYFSEVEFSTDPGMLNPESGSGYPGMDTPPWCGEGLPSVPPPSLSPILVFIRTAVAWRHRLMCILTRWRHRFLRVRLWRNAAARSDVTAKAEQRGAVWRIERNQCDVIERRREHSVRIWQEREDFKELANESVG